MYALVVGFLCLLCLLVAIAAGMLLARRLPVQHFSSNSKDVINRATAVVGTLAALALGLLVVSAKTTFQDADNELKTSSAYILLLDRILDEYGPETTQLRTDLKSIVEYRLNTLWNGPTRPTGEFVKTFESILQSLRKLEPNSPPQHLLQARALEVSAPIAQAYWLRTEAVGADLPWPFFAVLFFWLFVLFLSFGLVAPYNVTVVIVLTTCALSVAAAVFLSIEMDQPYSGIIHVSDAPLRTALSMLGRS